MCAGIALARQELRIALEELLTQTRHFEVCGELKMSGMPEVGPISRTAADDAPPDGLATARAITATSTRRLAASATTIRTLRQVLPLQRVLHALESGAAQQLANLLRAPRPISSRSRITVPFDSREADR